MVDEAAKRVLDEGKVRIKVKRAGMLQFIVFDVKRVKIGNTHFVELFANRVIETSELLRVANELGLPVEAANGRAFPEGKGAKDFLDL